MLTTTKRAAGMVAVLVIGFINAGLPMTLGQGAAGIKSAAGMQGASTTEPDARTEKQKALAKQTEKLFDMATELKAQVDKTNKNILSMKVVEKAQEIELLAKGMKTEARR